MSGCGGKNQKINKNNQLSLHTLAPHPDVEPPLHASLYLYVRGPSSIGRARTIQGSPRTSARRRRGESRWLSL